MFSPSREDHFIAAGLDLLRSFLSFLCGWLLVQLQPSGAEHFFQQDQNCWKGSKGQAALSLDVAFLTGFVPCCSLLAKAAPRAPAGEPWLLGTAWCLPSHPFSQ